MQHMRDRHVSWDEFMQWRSTGSTLPRIAKRYRRDLQIASSSPSIWRNEALIQEPSTTQAISAFVCWFEFYVCVPNQVHCALLHTSLATCMFTSHNGVKVWYPIFMQIMMRKWCLCSEHHADTKHSCFRNAGKLNYFWSSATRAIMMHRPNFTILRR